MSIIFHSAPSPVAVAPNGAVSSAWNMISSWTLYGNQRNAGMQAEIPFIATAMQKSVKKVGFLHFLIFPLVSIYFPIFRSEKNRNCTHLYGQVRELSVGCPGQAVQLRLLSRELLYFLYFLSLIPKNHT